MDGEELLELTIQDFEKADTMLKSFGAFTKTESCCDKKEDPPKIMISRTSKKYVFPIKGH